MFAETLEDIKKAIESIIVSEGMELVDIEYQRGKKRGILKIFIDRKEGGVTLDDCAQISREAGETLEIKELISHSYLLEVSSPGLNRRLKKEEDFGQVVKLLI